MIFWDIPIFIAWWIFPWPTVTNNQRVCWNIDDLGQNSIHSYFFAPENPNLRGQKIPGLVNVYKKHGKITFFHGKTYDFNGHFQWPFSIAMLVITRGSGKSYGGTKTTEYRPNMDKTIKIWLRPTRNTYLFQQTYMQEEHSQGVFNLVSSMYQVVVRHNPDNANQVGCFAFFRRPFENPRHQTNIAKITFNYQIAWFW